MRTIDLNADLGEGMGDDVAMLDLVTSASIACGAHAGDPETMFATLRRATERGVSIGAHPGYADRDGFGRRVIPMSPPEVARMVAAQIGSLAGVAALAGARVSYVKPHGALANLAADDSSIAAAITEAVRAVSPNLAVLAISGTVLETTARAAGLTVYSEIFADRAYLPTGRLVPRSEPGAVLEDEGEAAARLESYCATGLMPVRGGAPIPLAAHSVCVHGDNPAAVSMTQLVRDRLIRAGIRLRPFV